MITKITPNYISKTHNNVKNKNDIKNQQNPNLQNPIMDREFANSFKNFAINFKGLETTAQPMSKDMIFEYYSTESTENLLKKAAEIAINNKNTEVSHYHILKVTLLDVAATIKGLNSGELDYNTLDKSSVIGLFENYTAEDLFNNKESRTKAGKIIQKKLKEINALIKKLPKEKNTPESVSVSNSLINDILFYRTEPTESIDAINVINSAIYPKNKEEVRKFTNSIIYDLNNVLMVESTSLKDRAFFKTYEEKAKNIWKNLSLGTNMYLTYDPKKNSPKYFIPNLYHVLNNEKDGFGNLNIENTEIIELKENMTDTYLFEKIRTLAKDKTKNHVIIMYPTRMLKNSASAIEIANGQYVYKDEYINIMQNTPNNIKFIMIDNRDNVYAQLQNPIIKNMYQNFEEIPMPELSTSDIIKEFKEQPLLKKDIKKPFTKNALEKTVEASSMLDGIYPEKVQRLMKKIVSYYIDHKEISEVDVANYVKEAKDLFKKTNDDSSVEVVFDTGKRIKDIIGKESTKKDAMSIVREIKSKKMGTKGLIIYSQDETAGSGRRFTARAIAGEAKVPYIEINANYFGSDNVEIFGNNNNVSPEDAIKKVFALATTQADSNPNKSAVLFIEKFDNFVLGEYYNRYHQRAMAQLLNEMEKAERNGFNILVIGAISREEILGEAVRNSVKFIDTIQVTSPAYNSNARAEILTKIIKDEKVKLAAKNPDEKNELINSIANTTRGFSFSYLKTFVKRAQIVALEKGHKTVQKDDFTEAYLQISTGRPASDKIEPHEKLITASHECGHAVNAEVMNQLIKRLGKPWNVPNKVNFITLDPRGNYGGAMYHMSDNNKEHSFERVFSNIVCSYGGNSAEHLFFDIEGSSGIYCDLQDATGLAQNMVTYMGLGKNTGRIHINPYSNRLSEETKQAIDKDVSIILKNAANASDLITEMYADFNKKFTEKYAHLVGTGNCLIDGNTFRKELADWKASLPVDKQEELDLTDKILWDIMQTTKQGKIYA